MPHPAVKGNIIGRHIKKLREKAGLDQVELAAEIDVHYKIPLTQRIISEIEQGKRTVRTSLTCRVRNNRRLFISSASFRI